MTKEEALKKIEELKVYIEECDKKEKEIPEMVTVFNWNLKQCGIINEYDSDYQTWATYDRPTFDYKETANKWSFYALELAHLMYVREYLDINANNRHTKLHKITWGDGLRAYFVMDTKVETGNINDPWCFDDKENAEKVCEYLNRVLGDRRYKEGF